MPVRIMHIVDHLGKGGLENALVNLVANLDRRGYEHIVYAIRELGPNAERLQQHGAVVMCQHKQHSDSTFQVGTLARAIRNVRPDIVHSRNWAAIEGVAAAKWAGGCAIVHSEHGLEGGVDAKEPRRRAWFRRVSYELAGQVLAVSNQLRDLHAARTGFSKSRITVIHNGVDGSRFAADGAARSRVRRELGIQDDEFCLGCIGNLLPVKDHLTVLRAVCRLHEDGKPWKLVIAGEGSEREKLESFLREHPELSGRVILPGVSDRVPELLNAFDTYVLSSLSEGISNSLLEAMSTGLPVVATDTGGNPEVVVNDDSGILFPVGDADALARHLSELQGSPELRMRLGQAAVRRMRNEFSIGAMVGKYDRLYSTVRPGTEAPARAVARA